MDDLFDGDPEDTKKLRDEALRRVTEHGGNWQRRALMALHLIPGFEGTAEDIRIRLRMKGLEKPHHHNAWGAMIMEAIKQRRIIENGKRKHMKTLPSHGRETDVYVVLTAPLPKP
jgi:hypothetical protein